MKMQATADTTPRRDHAKPENKPSGTAGNGTSQPSRAGKSAASAPAQKSGQICDKANPHLRESHNHRPEKRTLEAQYSTYMTGERVEAAAPGTRAPSPVRDTVQINPEHFPNGPDPDAYAVVLAGTCLEPHAMDGDMAICSPAAPIRAGCIVTLWPAVGSPVIKRLVLEPMSPVGTPLHPDSDVVPLVIVEALNPPRQFMIRVDRLKAMHAVVGFYRKDEIDAVRVPPEEPPARSRKAKEGRRHAG